MKGIISILKRTIVSLVFLAFVLSNAQITFSGDNECGFYYYNPDSLQSNMVRLKSEMDEFVSHADKSISFQPFVHLIDFVNKVREKPPAYIFAPEWYLKIYGDEFQLKPFLIPLRNGVRHYQKILMASNNSDVNLKNIKGHSMAMTSMGPEGEMILSEILFSKYSIDVKDINIITVPKDSDALFALALGQVDTAFVVKDNLEKIKNLNPRIVHSIHSLIESEPIAMPVLCYSKAGLVSPLDVMKLKNMFLDSSKSSKRPNVMEMLQIDEWQNIYE